jgi:mRNA interferase RelE/StbE
VKAVSYSRTAIKGLKTLSAKDRDAVMDKIDAYAAGLPQDVVALKGSDFLRLRHRDWRVVFEETAETIAVLDVAHRREVYR